jgi:radical SAM superfamily enzyme YgiQ (UPF0313 family)
MLKIFLGDLVYDTVRTNYTVPLNIAYIAAYAKQIYTTDVDITIFKNPRKLGKAINTTPPDILGLSNYSWNERLNCVFLRMTKRLNPSVITVMGGPNIRTDYDEIEKYLSANGSLDYYILFNGEEPFGNLVEKVLGGDELSKPPLGCAGLVEGNFHFEPLDSQKKSKHINLTSPYLSGILDKFISDPNFIPLFETNRGCPFGCTYCTWGIAALSKVRRRSLDVVYEELNYIARKSAHQPYWICCDANFGILKRDVEIASMLRQIKNEYGYPAKVELWHSKNTGDRNIEIARILNDHDGYIAIQSADPEVLKNCGRGNINFKEIEKQIDYYKDHHIEVLTDILVGLPGETAESHLNTLIKAFDLGFGKIHPLNIRMLPGSQYESKIDREKYLVETKFRPIWGAYGIYDGQRVFEIEESVRATKDMSEIELEGFKIVHWLIYFCWNTGLIKPFLKYAQRHGVNPGAILYELYSTKPPSLANIFSKMEKDSMAEWFESKEEMILHYEQQIHFDELVNHFVKLNAAWVASMYQDPNIISALLSEIEPIINKAIKIENQGTNSVWDDLRRMTNRLICTDLLQNDFIERYKFSGEALSYALNDPNLSKEETIEVEIYRAKEDVDFCYYYLKPGGKKDLSLQNLTRFLEIGGMDRLSNKLRVLPK